MPSTTTTIELELAGRGAGWTAVTADVLEPLVIGYGIRGGGPRDRVASSGSCRFRLNNSATNSAGVLGYYSPGHPQARGGWAVGIRVRVSCVDPLLSETHVKFLGWVHTITPVPGVRGARTVAVTATDWLEEAARASVAGLATQIDKRSDQIVTTLVGNVARAPGATSYGTGRDTYAYALDTARDDAPNPVLQELARVVASELGYLYQRGDGTLVFEARAARVNTTAAATFDNSMSGLDVATTRDEIVSRVQVITHPRTRDAAPVVLYQLKSVATIPVGGSLTLLGGYTDPNNRAARVGGISMITPVATTDYLANAAADGSGTNLTASLTVVAQFGGNGVRWTLTNTSAVVLYVTKLQARGTGLYDYERTVAEATNPALAAEFGDDVLTLDMPYQSSASVGQDAARYVLGTYGQTEIGRWALGTAGSGELGVTTQLSYYVRASAASVSLAATTTATAYQILKRDVGDRIDLVETVTGVRTAYYVQAVDLTLAKAAPSVRWTLTPADIQTYWALGTTNFTELGTGTRLSY